MSVCTLELSTISIPRPRNKWHRILEGSPIFNYVWGQIWEAAEGNEAEMPGVKAEHGSLT